MRLLELMSPEDRDKFLALQEDKKLWLKAHEIFALKRNEVENYLKSIPEKKAQDMRRRLNQLRVNRKKRTTAN